MIWRVGTTFATLAPRPRGNSIEYAIGIVAATAVGLFATAIGLDKERSFYSVVLIVVATLYLLICCDGRVDRVLCR